MATDHAMAGDPVTVAVPEICAARLHTEAAEHLAIAAENVAEGATAYRAGRNRDRLDDADLPRLREAAEQVWPQVRRGFRDGSMSVTATRSTVAALLRSCVQATAEDIHDESHGPWSSEAVRGLAAELEAWAELFDAHGL